MIWRMTSSTAFMIHGVEQTRSQTAGHNPITDFRKGMPRRTGARTRVVVHIAASQKRRSQSEKDEAGSKKREHRIFSV